MSKYRKKPVVIDATQWWQNGDHPQDASVLLMAHTDFPFLSEGAVVRYYRHPDDDGQRACEHCQRTMHVHGWIDTLEGGHIVCPGDWVITGIKGENYPCKPDIFAATYECARLEDGASLIASERKRQVEAEGWSATHDDDHVCEELARAAAVYALPDLYRKRRYPTAVVLTDVPEIWPWSAKWWKPAPNDRVRELMKAGALIAAEIDRLQRAVAEDSAHASL